MRIRVTVFPKSGRFEIRSKEGEIKVYLKSPAESNKANLELMKELRKKLKVQVRIVAGLTSRKKTLEVDLPEQDLKRLLSI